MHHDIDQKVRLSRLGEDREGSISSRGPFSAATGTDIFASTMDCY
jgi:hypothetical protein